MTAPAVRAPLLPFDGSGIPEALRVQKRWAPWRAQWNEKRAKWDKIPHRADSPDYGLSTTEPGRWFSYGDALGAFEKGAGRFAGIGYVLTEPHGFVGVDLDGCIDEGVIAPWAAEIVANLNSYTEISPSGSGLRIFCGASIPDDWTNHEVGIEVYGGHDARFLTVTGAHVQGTPMDVRTVSAGAFDALRSQYGKPRASRAPSIADDDVPEPILDLLLPSVETLPVPAAVAAFLERGEAQGGDRSGKLFASGVALLSSGLSDEEAFSILVHNPHALEVALDHRGQDYTRALTYLWREHIVKAKRKASTPVTADDFEDVSLPEGAQLRLPSFKRANESGAILATKENITWALARPDICGCQLRLDTFRAEVMVASADGEDWRSFKDTDYHAICMRLERGPQGFKDIAKEKIRDAVAYVAESSAFDSAQHWLEGLVWDGRPRIETFLPTFFGAEDSSYTRAVGLYLWTALAGRVLEPGIKADMVPVAVGPQGAMKSSAVAAIVPAPDFFLELDLASKDDDLARLMRGKLVIELGELKGLRAKEVEHIKAFISRQHEEWVPKYCEMNARYSRRSVFFGTTNQDQFLTDDTGNRRWLPFHVSRCDPDGVKAARELLWAEARETFKARGVDRQSFARIGV